MLIFIYLFFAGTADFYALNYYSTRMVTHGHDTNPQFNPDAEYVTSANISWPVSPVTPWLIVMNAFDFPDVYYH